MSALDWDAATYDRIADPQEAWAREIIARMELRGDELVLDAGCGSGRVTRLLLERLPRGGVLAVDASSAMVAQATAALGAEVAAGRLAVEVRDLLELALDEPVDAVFSCAVFHHIHDHPRLFSRLHAALRAGGRLTAQCGGAGNIDRFRRVSDEVCAREPYGRHLADMDSPWNYATPEGTEQRLLAAGFARARCWTEPKPTFPADARAFTRSVLLNYHGARLRERAGAREGSRLAEELTSEVLAAMGEPLRLDYVRLNIEAVA
ncbi:MAG: methyltransferase domain-containing protein [Acidobacteriota bacterium]|nr:methyltransferase domain-containing protein [Acidobacteriota bacterium]